MKLSLPSATLLLVTPLLLLCERAASFAPVVLRQQQNAVQPRSPLSAAVVGGEGSEWYSPPPPQALPKRRPGAGQRAIQSTIQTEQEFNEFLNNGDDRLVIVKFYASWCKSCAKFGMKLDQFAAENADHVSRDGALVNQGSVRIVTVEYAAAKELCCSLGITKLPTVQMYKKENGSMKKVQDFSCPPSQFHRVKDLTAAYLDQAKAQKKAQDAEFDRALAAGHEMMQQTLAQTEHHADIASQLEAAAEHVYGNAAASANRPRKSLWNRLRRSKD